MAATRGRLPDLAAVCRRAFAAESGELRTGAGWMDFLSCAHGGVCAIAAGPAAGMPRITRLADQLDVPVVLIDTGQRRATTRALTNKRRRYAGGESDIMLYAKAGPLLVTELRTALASPQVDYRRVGAIITEAHTLLRDRMRCSTPLIEECVARCLHAGAYGAKLTGSGHGGCLFALVPWEKLEPVRAAVSVLPVRVMVFTTGEPHGVLYHPPP